MCQGSGQLDLVDYVLRPINGADDSAAPVVRPPLPLQLLGGLLYNGTYQVRTCSRHMCRVQRSLRAARTQRFAFS